MRYILAFYEIDRAYGGSEEGGWWFDTGTLVRIHSVHRDEARAVTATARANRLLDRLQFCSRSVGSLLYTGGQHQMCLFENTVPSHFPQVRPHYG
jgi:hypothetical protein